VQVLQWEDPMDDSPQESQVTGQPAVSIDDGESSPPHTSNGNGFHRGDRIARLAYQRFEDRGFEHGHDLEDWLEAERELFSGEEQ
jgi:hypothetical protein